MLIIDCPYCGPRPELEFAHGGQAHVARPADPSRSTDAEWTEYLYLRKNTRGIYAERWRHARGCGRFFNALRDTTTDQFLATYRAGENPPAVAADTRRAGGSSP
jgi:sarcosine oxidase subunit delta